MKVCGSLLAGFFLSLPGAYAGAVNVNLGTAGSFAVLAGSTVTNTGNSLVSGNVGVSPGTAITGFPPGVVSLGTGTLHGGDATALQAQNDLITAVSSAGNETCGSDLSGTNLGGMTLTTGVYCFSSSAELTGMLTLDDQGDPNSVFVFKIGTALNADNGSAVNFVHGTGANVYWQVGSSATIGTSATFEGNILANTSITLNTGATIQCGSALAESGAVTLDSNTVAVCQSGTTVVPEPTTWACVGIGLLLGLPVYWQAGRFSRLRIQGRR
jgi:type VI secretion system secreted protein VgrG